MNAPIWLLNCLIGSSIFISIFATFCGVLACFKCFMIGSVYYSRYLVSCLQMMHGLCGC